MAEMSTQEAGGVLADDLMRDRARQFVEFLDDDVRLLFSVVGTANGRHKRPTTTGMGSGECWIMSKSG